MSLKKILIADFIVTIVIFGLYGVMAISFFGLTYSLINPLELFEAALYVFETGVKITIFLVSLFVNYFFTYNRPFKWNRWLELFFTTYLAVYLLVYVLTLLMVIAGSLVTCVPTFRLPFPSYRCAHE